MADATRITILAGAGASRPFGYPLTDELSREVILGDRFSYHAQLRDRYLLLDRAIDDQMVRFITDICRDLIRGTPNYEQIYSDVRYIKATRANQGSILYHYARQLDDFLEEKIKHHFGDIDQYRPWLDVPDTEDPFNATWSLVLVYISNSVRQIIWSRRDPTLPAFDEIALYSDLLEVDSIGELEIFTLNHDLLFEDYFIHHNITFDDMVIENQGVAEVTIEHGDTNEPAAPDYLVKLYKLHGSIDWFEAERLLPGGVEDFLGEATPFDFRIPFIRKVEDVREFISNYDFHNVQFGIVMGAEKGIEYVDYPYLQLLSQFVSNLENTDRLVVIGYGFRDRAINHIIRAWRDKRPDHRRMMVITRGPQWAENTPIAAEPFFEDGIEVIEPEQIIQFTQQ